MKNYQIASVVALVCLITPALAGPAHHLEARQASSKLDAIRSNLKPIGNFTAVQHKVEGMVWALNDSIIIIENFVYDGKGFGVFMHVATEGNSLREFIANKQAIGYPNPKDISKPIEKEYKKEDKKILVLRLPENIKSSDIKWLSVWCDIFNTSFGHVLFP